MEEKYFEMEEIIVDRMSFMRSRFMDIHEGMKAIEIICDYDKNRIMSWLKNGGCILPPTEEVRKACEFLSIENVYPFDAEADDLTLVKQINDFVNRPFREESDL